MKPLDPELLAAIAEQPGSFGPIWSEPANHLAALAADLGTTDGRQRSFHRTLAAGYFTQFTAYSDPDFVSQVVDWQMHELQTSGLDLAALSPQVAESTLVRRETLVQREDRILSPDFLRYLAYAALLQQHAILTKPRPRILEIGSGYGGLARVLKLLVPDATIVLADLPSSLVYAFLFLCTEFPNVRVAVVKEGDTPDVFADVDFVSVPVNRANCLRGMNVDLAINVWSFGEIPNERIGQWFDLLQNDMNVDWLFLLNSFLKRLGPRSSDELDFGKWLPQLDARWRVAHFEIDPRIHRCPYVTSFPSGAALVCQRIHGENELDRERVQAREEFDRLLSADWISAPGPLDAAAVNPQRFIETSHHVGCWHIDTGTSGPVFRLWQQFRLNRDKRALRLLSAYLQIVRGHGGETFRFKDEFFLLELLSPEELEQECLAFFREESPIVLEFGIQAASHFATLLRDGGGVAEAESLFQQILEIAPGHAESMFQLGALAEVRHELEQARDWYLRAYALYPENPNYRERAVRVCVLLGWRQLCRQELLTGPPPPETASDSRREQCWEYVKQAFASRSLTLEDGDSALIAVPFDALVQQTVARAFSLIGSEWSLDEPELLTS